ncbi:MAG TPA: hypothetical protein VHI13_17440 [Candidatus Kapabacteria bacterium]|nr:hypothetical protein [Candidatus Kapabacteria bacterium]
MADASFSNDSWALASIALAHGDEGCDLRAIVAASDYLNHAILSYPELAHALALLHAAGCVEELNGRLALTGPAATWLASVRDLKPFKLPAAAGTFMAALQAPESEGDLPDIPWLTEERMRDARDAYVGG